jgi:hypothetical protein
MTEQLEIESCSCCGSDKEVMPKAGSGVNTHWICKKCVMDRGIDVLPEYLENIKDFGTWHRPLNTMKQKCKSCEEYFDRPIGLAEMVYCSDACLGIDTT